MRQPSFSSPQNFFLLGSWRLSGSPHGLTSLCREEKRERELCALLGPRQCHVSPRQARPDAPTPAFPADSAAIHPALPSITGQDRSHPSSGPLLPAPGLPPHYMKDGLERSIFPMIMEGNFSWPKIQAFVRLHSISIHSIIHSIQSAFIEHHHVSQRDTQANKTEARPPQME